MLALSYEFVILKVRDKEKEQEAMKMNKEDILAEMNIKQILESIVNSKDKDAKSRMLKQLSEAATEVLKNDKK